MTKAASDNEDVAHRAIMKGKSERKTEILKGTTKMKVEDMESLTENMDLGVFHNLLFGQDSVT